MTCAHCGLPAAFEEQGRPFCCSGCVAAWDLLHDRGLAQYYTLPERRAEAVRASGRSYEEFDHAAFQARHVRRDGACADVELYLEGVRCASCVWLVERMPRAVPGLLHAELDFARARVRLRFDPARVALSSLACTLDGLGYRPHPFRGAETEALRRKEDRAALVRIGVAGAIATNVMLLAIALYSGWFGGMDPVLTRYFRWLSLVLVTPSLFGPGRVFFASALRALKNRSLHMDVPIALALLAGWSRGLVNTVTDRGHVYFDAVAALVFLLLVGRFLQLRAQRAAAEAGSLLYALTPSTARVVQDEHVREIPSEALLPGMVCEVRALETVPADGVVLEGRSELDLSLLTGESRPVSRGEGDEVHAGTVNRTATLRIKVARTGEESRIGQILREVERGTARRAPVVQLTDRLAGAFVGAVLVLALVTAALWWRNDAARAVDLAIALLVVTCPCALAMATPLAVTVAIGRAARRGILLKSGAALEQLSRPSTILLDKTGTVTEGRARLLSWDGPDEARAWVLALERHSTHPIANGFREAWADVAVPRATEVRSTMGGGIEGVVDGRRVAIGSPAFVGAPFDGPGDETPVRVAVNGAVVARASFGDAIRSDAPAALAALRALGFRPKLLSGDDPRVVASVGARLGFAPEDIEGGATPERKLEAVEEELVRGPVVMVGDGVNDAAAIARASVGIGVHGGAEASAAAADVFLTRPGLSSLVELVDGSRRTMRVIRRNIAFSLVYNAVGATLALCGWLDPLVAALLMPASSFTVVLGSWLGRTFDAPREVPAVPPGPLAREVAA